ncbi:hypothetical protein [Micromonospora zhanjiangensis]|uniref:PPE family protein n=1 Tax=Micromonospora zhanjiangensis TaxID=1522057 RepID=A0ABV8KLB1_9ACTN
MELNDGGSSGITDWSRQTVPQMWEKLADQHTDDHWKVADGWKKTCDLTSYHLSRVQQYRDSLAAAWPPGKSQAAAEYVNRLDFLIQSLRGTHEVASANYTTFSAATTAISATRSKLEKLHQEYVAKAGEKQKYDERQASLKQAGFDGVHGRPPVTDAELEALNAKARTMMYGLSTELVQAQVQIQRPPVYRSPGNRAPDDPSQPGGGSAPVIPPIVPVPVDTSGGLQERASESGRAPVPTPRAPSPGSVIGGNGPILGSAGTQATHLPAAPVPAIPAPSPIGGPTNFSAGFPPQSALPGAPGRPLANRPIGPTGGLPLSDRLNGATRFPIGEAPVASRPLPPGGLIGGGPGLGQPGGAATQPRRINPVGGVIGGGTGSTPVGSTSHRPSQGARKDSISSRGHAWNRVSPEKSIDKEKTRVGKPWDPDNPWEVEEGVPPVLLPPEAPGPIDPGPAIGLDR